MVFAYSNSEYLAAGAFTGALGRVAGENVATSPYNYTLGNLSAGTNYNLILAAGSFAITAKDVTITPTSGQSKIFGAADPVFAYGNSESLAAGAFTGALGRVAGENVYTSPYNYTLGNLSAGTNYNLILAAGSFAITAKDVTITPTSGQSKIYGAADPVFAYSNSESLAAGAFTGALGRVAGENVATSPYNYTLGNLSAGTNYNLILAAGSFAITAKDVTITPTSGQSKIYGAADPVFAYSNSESLAAGAFAGT